MREYPLSAHVSIGVESPVIEGHQITVESADQEIQIGLDQNGNMYIQDGRGFCFDVRPSQPSRISIINRTE